MSRVTFFIDGFNIYHALDSTRNFHKYKWLDLTKLSNLFIKKTDSIEKIFYFTALATWSQKKIKRHKNYIKANELNGIKPVYGKFKSRDKYCPMCRKVFTKPEEKQTDVNIAICLLEEAMKDNYDTAIIISGDSDLIPSIKAVRKNFPNKQTGIVIPIGRSAEELKNVSDFHIKMKLKHLNSSRLPNEINLGDGDKLVCPSEWR
ncbi:NYN domain-containing protein [Candidatus Margulisiibacteriota bacterium]